MEHEYTPPKKPTAPDAKERPEQERAHHARRVARTVLRTVMAESAEPVRPKLRIPETLRKTTEALREKLAGAIVNLALSEIN